jgi:lipopolysaccharide transport system permease protein
MVCAIKARQVSRTAAVDAALPLLGSFFTLVGGMLLAVQVRLQLPIGNALGEDYVALPFALFLVMALAVVVVYLLGQSTTQLPAVQRWIGARHPYRRLLVMLVVSFVGLFLLFPDISQLQLAYYLLFCPFLGIFVIALPTRTYIGQPGNDVISDLSRLWKNRFLMAMWLRHNIEARYSQHVLGVLWIILLPVSTAVVLTVAFTQLMRTQLDVPFIAFYLSALVHYNIFSNGMSNAAVVVTNKMSLITQVYFPREILPIVALGEVLVDFLFTFTAMLLINAAYGIFPNIYFIYLPLLLLILASITLGLMLIFSAVSVLIRDIPQLVGVGMQLLFFMTPIIYPIETLPVQYRFLFVINPLAAVIQGFRDVIVYNRAPDIVTLFYPLVFGATILVFGYALFKAIEDRMADML